jgi:hypothetical protein
MSLMAPRLRKICDKVTSTCVKTPQAVLTAVNRPIEPTPPHVGGSLNGNDISWPSGLHLRAPARRSAASASIMRSGATAAGERDPFKKQSPCLGLGGLSEATRIRQAGQSHDLGHGRELFIVRPIGSRENHRLARVVFNLLSSGVALPLVESSGVSA